MTNENDDGVSIEVRMIPVDHIEINDYNPNEMDAETFEVLVANLKEDDTLSATILVRPHPQKADRFIIVDGEHRYKGAKLANLTEVACIVAQMNEEKAKIRTLSMNAIRGKNVPLKLAKLIVSLQETHTIAQIAAMTGVKVDEQEKALKLLEVPKFQPDSGVHFETKNIELPTEVKLMLMPGEHTPYTAAMKKAMRLGGENTTLLIGNEVEDYTKAMSDAMGLAGMKLRNVALATICCAFLDMPEDQKKAAAQKTRQKIIDKRASDATQKQTQVQTSDKRVKIKPITKGGVKK